MTLTHACHNAFADSGGILTPLPPLHHGLSDFGVELIKEMNRYEFVSLFKGVFILTKLLRLGMLVDLSHTSDDTARHTLNVTRAPVIWSHSSAHTLHDVPRNVPDDILKRIGYWYAHKRVTSFFARLMMYDLWCLPGFPHGKNGRIDAVVMVNFSPYFLANPGVADVKIVADHIKHIAGIAGKKQCVRDFQLDLGERLGSPSAVQCRHWLRL